ncbi:hypothetical protein [Stenotrophomonas sp. ZAC14A_NAIMI4_1]|uniref:GTP pyrophosphokinase n=1 Tax=Stenotrophomonas sp. ZAC14A_NAIMI4_1 TaxID=2072412 RepID=UPI000D53F04A|nr:hypothetical protein [Stenotrophomonas sp. ZAC14A_NAIMI4_1]AWH44520.1 hypothetical protein C1926_05535 [Stenotrophomonas sp. ZAC14A_NAIMI4_1]
MRSDFDIGAYIDEHRLQLQEWGGVVASEISALHASLLKMPVSPRVKDVESARKKQFKKKYADPAVDMTDLVGVRFVVLTSDDLIPILETIKSSSRWKHKQTRNPDDEAATEPDKFGYQSHHYELRPQDGPPWCCEVQVRTLLQHTMAELSHDAIYKASQDPPSQALRLVARSIALMETTDELLCMAMGSVRASQAPFEAFRKEALSQAAAVGGGGAELLDDLFGTYPAYFSYEAISDFRDFIARRDYIFSKISSRRGRGIFGFPASCLVVYWLASKSARRVERKWPFPGAIAELRQVFSDIGESA